MAESIHSRPPPGGMGRATILKNPKIGLRQNKTGSPRRASTNQREGTAVSACLETP